LKWMSVRLTSEADMEGRLMRKIAILESTGGVKGEGFVANHTTRSHSLQWHVKSSKK